MARRILEEGNIVYQYDLFQNSDLLFIKLILLEHKGGDMLSILDDIDVSRDRDILTLEKSDLEILEKWLDENKKEYDILRKQYLEFTNSIKSKNINVLDYMDEIKKYIDSNFGDLIYFYLTVKYIANYIKKIDKEVYYFIGD